MHIVENTSKSGKKIYRSILLRESYREDGKVKKRTIANLSNCTAGEIEAIKLALRHKEDLSALGALSESVELQEGHSVGALWSVYQVAKELGIEKALGNSFEGKLALWQVLARVLNQGSRLSATRLAQVHAVGDVLDMGRGFDENDLYDNLAWVSENQERIERKLFELRRRDTRPKLFLYDVTSRYLEGDQNYFGQYGYNRDGKKGKKQIVIGLLCDESGEPVSTEVFTGNTQDQKTFESQVKKMAERFGCKEVTIVGDRGMIKTMHIERLPEGFHYITAITKPQIEALIKRGILQLELFEEKLCEVKDEGTRYILRRNPTRAKEMAETRRAKFQSIESYIERKNEYLREHQRASVSKALEATQERLRRLRLEGWVGIKEEGRMLKLESNEGALQEESCLDGCYVIKTDLKETEADKYLVHERYKDLSEVEKVFRDCKRVNLVYVRKEKSTQGHVFMVMLAHMILRRLRTAWAGFELTVQEGLQQLATICTMEVILKGQQARCQKIPQPREQSRNLLEALQIKLPAVLPRRNIRVVIRKKLTNRRINQQN
ncbi:MAG: IS1634 family transposase [Candidatus Jettenia caeni]|nr:IS1634 family transposase [Candidatus Jettenia caeni]UJS16625.1 MAG: IS1634 family transposase [Candidatus Jettenia sp.]